MAEIVRMPKLSDTMTEGVVVEWHKKVGDKVESGELLAEIETDKATMDFESFQDGVLLYIGVEKGKAAAVDSILAILGEKGENIQPLLAAEKKSANTSATLSTLPKAEVIQEKKTEKVFAPVPSQEVGISTPSSTDGRVKASPIAKKLAEKKGINITLIKGTGDGGRVTKRDIENYTHAAAAGSKAVSKESFKEVEVSQMRKTIARKLSESKFSAPHFYLTIEIDMDKAIDARKSIEETGNAKISFNDLIIKAVAASLHKHPKVNASWLGDKVRYNEHIHIGIAVSVNEGLLVPVVKFANGKSLTQISNEVKALAEKAKNKKILPEEMQGNTFTISNLGMFGIEEFTAIINPPDACIMAVGAIKQTPVVKNGDIVPGNVMKVTLSCDHRIVDGATGSEFLQTFKQMVENPVLFLGAQPV